MSFPRYPKYKDSGVEWLGQVPEHWTVQRLKYACHAFPSNVDKKSYDGETPVLLCNYTDVYYNETITAALDFMAATASPEQIARFRLRAGDTIITKDSETADDIAIGAYVPKDLSDVVCGYHLSIVRPMPNTHGAFVKRLFDSIYAKACFEVRANGLTRVGLGQYEIDNVELPFPHFAEQTAIAAFLDRETAKIDALVAEQQRLIELLKEKRQAVISHAVTKGLNPNAPMKPSRVEWVGDVPEHWKISKMKQVSSLKGRLGWQGLKADEYREEGPYVVSSAHFDNFKIDWNACPHVSMARYELDANIQLSIGDVLIMKDGAALGKLAYIDDLPGRACMNSHLLLFRPYLIDKEATYIPKFLFFIMQTGYFQEYIQLYATGTTFLGISQEEIGNYRVVVPPLAEQTKIVSYLEEATARFDALTAEAQRAIDLLQERRTALISAAVTGQIDVRKQAVA